MKHKTNVTHPFINTTTFLGHEKISHELHLRLITWFTHEHLHVVFRHLTCYFFSHIFHIEGILKIFSCDFLTSFIYFPMRYLHAMHLSCESKKMIHCFNVTFKNDCYLHLFIFIYLYIPHILLFSHVISTCDSFNIPMWFIHSHVIYTWFVHLIHTWFLAHDSFITWIMTWLLHAIHFSCDFHVINTWFVFQHDYFIVTSLLHD